MAIPGTATTPTPAGSRLDTTEDGVFVPPSAVAAAPSPSGGNTAADDSHDTTDDSHGTTDVPGDTTNVSRGIPSSPHDGPPPNNHTTADPDIDPSLPQRPTNLDAVPSLLGSLQRDTAAYLSSLSSSSPSSTTMTEPARQALVRQARALQQALATPRETMIEHCWAQPGVAAAITVGVDVGLWRLMAARGEGRAQTVAELAVGTGVEGRLLGRLMRHLAAMGYLEETGPDEYKPTNFSKALSLETMGDGYFPMLVVGGAAQHGFVEFARARGYRGLDDDGRATACMHAHGTDQNFFALNAARGYETHFAHHMAGYRAGRPAWTDPGFYPVRERLMAGYSDWRDDDDDDDKKTSDGEGKQPEREEEEKEPPAFLVDVGGSTGHDLARFRAAHPDHPGTLVLEDLPAVVAQCHRLDTAAIRVVAHDFFAPQPVRGARAYYLHSVLHDWADADCGRILRRTAAAMRPRYSRLLVHENVVPARNAGWETTALDLVMLTLCGSRERTAADWEALLGGCGLRLVGVWSVADGVESLMECELA